ncbi:MAG: KdsC family phosphatase [Pseudohongiellaceae bacterium]|uniref:3-deoxy-D-manno-octulosonate 8-phosphate phosphatase KdsC n=1 Tax=OM182 bacterium MED-G28 TaxID=1986256 RepID=A0A2A5W972_9GAMM|nr:phenylphosphate carboxylase subunit delta [Gammaproteobacteria bacterium]PDH33039.1 MAG: phenylphosphate carboxylase subunit delta [OM182 bacterium MED-G28]|tara:strand:- start:1673 stop:2200 length:528 start_codon:yes stop_codon:yes gene_type:complete
MQSNLEQESLKNAASKIKLLALDVDGVLTDGRLYFSNSGEETKAFHSLDGHGIKMLLSTGVDVGIITGRTSLLVEKRAKDLGIEIIYQGREDKLQAINEIVADKDYPLEEVAYVGDDLPDLPAIQSVGLGFSVPNGHSDVRAAAAAVTLSAGGSGAVREITDFIIKSQNKNDNFI